jgi:2-desacetyl-2-hydroxyethyl bacteriochlorophyllide A dehydrogenase
MMKAAVVEKIGLLRVKKVSEPQMDEYDALCEILYGTICPGTDWHIIEGKHPRKVNYPTILGHESIGRVIKIGKKVRNFKIGDLVSRVGAPAAVNKEYYSNWGGFAEFGIAKDHRAMKQDCLPEEAWNKSRVNQIIPDDIKPIAAPMIITWRETLSYIRRMGVSKNKRLLILGSGANGIAFAAHAHYIGLSEITMVGNLDRRDAAIRAGATNYLNYKDSDIQNKINDIIKYQNYDFIIDAVGKNGLIDSKLNFLTDGGTIGVYGYDDYFTNSITLFNAKGSFYYYNGGYDEEEAHKEVILRIIDKQLDAHIWIDTDNPFELKRINNALNAVKNRDCIKALIKIRG